MKTTKSISFALAAMLGITARRHQQLRCLLPKAAILSRLHFSTIETYWTDAFQDVADQLEAEKGIKVVQESASSTVYFETLQSKLISGEMPDMFQMLVGKSNFNDWNTECADLYGEAWCDKVPSSIIDMCDYDGKLLAYATRIGRLWNYLQ